MATATRRGWLDKMPSSGKRGSWQKRWIVLIQEGSNSKISWYGDQKDEKEKAPKGSFELGAGTQVGEATEGFIISKEGQKALPLRHSLAEHQKMWMDSIKEAIEGKLTPSAEDTASAAMKNMNINSEAGRERSQTQMEKAKVVRCMKGWGFLGLTVSDSKRGAGVVVTKLETGSQLKACGLNVGDSIMTIGKTMVKNHKDTITEINAAKPEDMLVFTMALCTHKVRVDKSQGNVGTSLRNNPSGTGVSVCGLSDNSIATRFGLELNDEIIAVNDELINDHAAAVTAIDGAQRYVDFIVVGESESTDNVRSVMVEKVDGCSGDLWNEQVNCEGREGQQGVTITSLTDASALATAGIKVGDLVYSVNNVPVRNVEGVRAQLAISDKRAHFLMPA